MLVNYATPHFAACRRVSSAAALQIGGFDRVIEMSPTDLSTDFRRRYAHHLRHPLGAGYWVWKPHVIERALAGCGDDDCLFYCEAGVAFTAAADPLVALLRSSQTGVLTFANHWLERQWTKRDAFEALGCAAPAFTDSPQVVSGLSGWRRRRPEALDLLREWLCLMAEERLVANGPSRSGPEHPSFREHRHDQSLFSVLCKRRGIDAYRAAPWRPPDPADAQPDYPVLARRNMNSAQALMRFAGQPGIPPALCGRAAAMSHRA
ncbi:MAG: hypothetical protein OXQ29_14160 [Rhodospirillaceae bacterium]|nr:hypothetical protein [Rhodospirillaceae bacterium]